LKSQKEGTQPNQVIILLSQVLHFIIELAYKKDLSPEQIFYYIYAVLYSNIYRTKYAEFLKIDFPRVPFTSDYKLFIKMGEYGKRLVDLHLLKSKDLNKSVAKFQGKGNNKVEKLKYEGGEPSGCLYINNRRLSGLRKVAERQKRQGAVA
jgi:predicted helicase